ASSGSPGRPLRTRRVFRAAIGRPSASAMWSALTGQYCLFVLALQPHSGASHLLVFRRTAVADSRPAPASAMFVRHRTPPAVHRAGSTTSPCAAQGPARPTSRASPPLPPKPAPAASPAQDGTPTDSFVSSKSVTRVVRSLTPTLSQRERE